MTLQDTMNNPELNNLDLSQVAALQQKRTLAFVNHFVVTTVQFLNNFMKQSEHKLMKFERKLENVEAALILLETRLSSIPEVNTTTTETKPEQILEDTHQTKTEVESQPPVDDKQIEEHSVETDSKPTTEDIFSPEYNRFVKMVQVGVPLQAVKLKVSLEGLDPDVLEKIINKK